MARITSFRDSGPRYPALRLFEGLCRVAGTFLLLIGAGLLLVAGLYATSPERLPVLATLPPLVVAGYALFWSLATLFWGFQTFAMGAFIRLMIHVEENTRVTAQVLEKLGSRPDGHPENINAILRS